MKEAESFVYLRSVIDKLGDTDREVAARIRKARRAFVTLKNIWAAKEINLKTKLRIFNCEDSSTIRMRNMEENKEDIAENPDFYQQLSEADLPHTLAG